MEKQGESILFQGPKKNPKAKNHTNSTKEKFLDNSRALHGKTKVLRQIAPESSLESSAKSWSHKLFGVPFVSLTFVDNLDNSEHLENLEILEVFQVQRPLS